MQLETKTHLTNQMNFSIHPATRIGQVTLNVADLDRQLDFYQHSLGFHLHWRKDGRAALGNGLDDFLQLIHIPGAKRYHRVTGLYHFAVRYPSRHELARAIARLFELNVQNQPTDHIMTKSTYLEDPEGNGIELYAESPEDGVFVYEYGGFGARRADGRLSDGREALDLQALFSQLTREDHPQNPISAQVSMGHIHLHVCDLQDALDFYHGVLGFDIMGIARPFQVAFVSAGGYHHHIGLNTWQGVGIPQPPANAQGLRTFSVILPHQDALNAVLERVDRAGLSLETVEGGQMVLDPCLNGVLLKINESAHPDPIF
jgi:catechol 2,3-dioxygenase